MLGINSTIYVLRGDYIFVLRIIEEQIGILQIRTILESLQSSFLPEFGHEQSLCLFKNKSNKEGGGKRPTLDSVRGVGPPHPFLK